MASRAGSVCYHTAEVSTVVTLGANIPCGSAPFSGDVTGKLILVTKNPDVTYEEDEPRFQDRSLVKRSEILASDLIVRSDQNSLC